MLLGLPDHLGLKIILYWRTCTCLIWSFVEYVPFLKKVSCDPEKQRHAKELSHTLRKHWLSNFLWDSVDALHLLALTDCTGFLGNWEPWDGEAELSKYSNYQIETYSFRLLGSEPTLTLATFRFQLAGVKHKCRVAEWFPHASFVYLSQGRQKMFFQWDSFFRRPDPWRSKLISGDFEVLGH